MRRYEQGVAVVWKCMASPKDHEKVKATANAAKAARSRWGRKR